MANITINEISQNYSYNIGTSSYACVAMPITASWGPYFDLSTMSDDETIEDIQERTQWERFSATQSGLESFVATYRGAASCYRLAKDFSYQMALTLLSAGYDVLVCRIAPGAKAQAVIEFEAPDLTEDGKIQYDTVQGVKTIKSVKKKYAVSAKYPGTFGNNLEVVVKPNLGQGYVSVITYVVDTSGVRTAVENLTCTVLEQTATDSILHIDETESKFLEFVLATDEVEVTPALKTGTPLSGGTDLPAFDGEDTIENYANIAAMYAAKRYLAAGFDIPVDSSTNLPKLDKDDPKLYRYVKAILDLGTTLVDKTKSKIIAYRELIFYDTFYALELLEDKLAYNHNRVFTSGWDDQDYRYLQGDDAWVKEQLDLSPFHRQLLSVAYNSRCATSMIDVPRSLSRSWVYNESEDDTKIGYAQMLARYLPADEAFDLNGTLFSSHAALFAPWSQYRYVSTTRNNIAPPSFVAMMIQRAMITNQSIQYEWALPVSRKHTLNIGKLDYKVPKKILDVWQKLSGVGVNIITDIPGLGMSLWGNSTLFEVPPATYQALANLSTRYLVNAIEDVIWKVGVSITFRYNNNDAYNSFYAGCTPLLDTMVNVGAIEGYKITMSADIDGLDHVNANTVIGQIIIIVNGVINDIVCDLIALPAGASLDNM